MRCQPDMDARGVTGKLIDGVTLVDYAGFVDLTRGIQHLAFVAVRPPLPRYNFFIWRKT
jgi:sulfur transfer complex TusBCD TusB component (DsrH family)